MLTLFGLISVLAFILIIWNNLSMTQQNILGFSFQFIVSLIIACPLKYTMKLAKLKVIIESRFWPDKGTLKTNFDLLSNRSARAGWCGSVFIQSVRVTVSHHLFIRHGVSYAQNTFPVKIRAVHADSVFDNRVVSRLSMGSHSIETVNINDNECLDRILSAKVTRLLRRLHCSAVMTSMY